MHGLQRFRAFAVSAFFWTSAVGSFLIPGALYAADSTTTLQTVNASAFAKLRSDYASQPMYDPAYVADEQRRELTEAIKAKDAERIVALGQPWLERCPIDADARIQVAMALDALGRYTEAFRHLYSYHGLIESILESGAGTSKESAFKVISIAEEYDVLRVLRAKLIQQSLSGSYDVMKVEIDNEEKTLYFDVSTSLEAMGRQLEGPN